MQANPIYKRFFERARIISGRAYDNPKSIIFRKHLAMWEHLSEHKPSSQPTANLVERRAIDGACIHHVLWSVDDEMALRDSSAIRLAKRAPNHVKKADAQMKRYFLSLRNAISHLAASAQK